MAQRATLPGEAYCVGWTALPIDPAPGVPVGGAAWGGVAGWGLYPGDEVAFTFVPGTAPVTLLVPTPALPCAVLDVDAPSPVGGAVLAPAVVAELPVPYVEAPAGAAAVRAIPAVVPVVVSVPTAPCPGASVEPLPAGVPSPVETDPLVPSVLAVPGWVEPAALAAGMEEPCAEPA